LLANFNRKSSEFILFSSAERLATRAGEAMLLVTSPQVIVRVAKIENKIVAVAARERFAVIFESTVERETQDSFVCPGRRENILVLRERK
jgi:hypothetical protein